MDALPNDEILRRHILCFPNADFAIHFRSIERGRNLDNDVARAQFRREVGFDVNSVVDSGFSNFFDDGLNSEGEIDIRCGAISAEGAISKSTSGRGRKERVQTNLINSNSPSGGMKEIVRSLSNFPSLTH